MLKRVLRGLISCPIDEQQGVVPPISVLGGQNGRQLGDEETEHVLVGVDLVEGAIQTTRSADCQLHSYTWRDLAVHHRVDLPSHPPLTPREVHLVDPCLVKIDDSGSRCQLIQYELRVEHTQLQASRRVAEKGHLLDGLVACTKVIA